jgi:hypothetical protein
VTKKFKGIKKLSLTATTDSSREELDNTVAYLTLVISTVVFLIASSRNTGENAFHGANSKKFKMIINIQKNKLINRKGSETI